MSSSEEEDFVLLPTKKKVQSKKRKSWAPPEDDLQSIQLMLQSEQNRKSKLEKIHKETANFLAKQDQIALEYRENLGKVNTDFVELVRKRGHVSFFHEKNNCGIPLSLFPLEDSDARFKDFWKGVEAKGDAIVLSNGIPFKMVMKIGCVSTKLMNWLIRKSLDTNLDMSNNAFFNIYSILSNGHSTRKYSRSAMVADITKKGTSSFGTLVSGGSFVELFKILGWHNHSKYLSLSTPECIVQNTVFSLRVPPGNGRQVEILVGILTMLLACDVVKAKQLDDLFLIVCCIATDALICGENYDGGSSKRVFSLCIQQLLNRISSDDWNQGLFAMSICQQYEKILASGSQGLDSLATENIIVVCMNFLELAEALTPEERSRSFGIQLCKQAMKYASNIKDMDLGLTDALEMIDPVASKLLDVVEFLITNFKDFLVEKNSKSSSVSGTDVRLLAFILELCFQLQKFAGPTDGKATPSSINAARVCLIQNLPKNSFHVDLAGLLDYVMVRSCSI